MWHKPCRTFHPWCLCIKTRCLFSYRDFNLAGFREEAACLCMQQSSTGQYILTEKSHQNWQLLPYHKTMFTFSDSCLHKIHTLLTLKQWVIFFQNMILFSDLVHYKCNILVWNWFNTINISSALVSTYETARGQMVGGGKTGHKWLCLKTMQWAQSIHLEMKYNG